MKNTAISTSMDSHENVSKKLATNSDLITYYRMAPHEDAMESKQRALDNLIDRLTSEKENLNIRLGFLYQYCCQVSKQAQELIQEKLYSKVAPMTKKWGY